jgi:hypothetical protein
VASYGGDAFNNATSTACNDLNETSTVTKASPTITTQATVSANAGGVISDTAILAGGNAPTGGITFTLFGPDSVACSGTPVFTWTAAVSGDGSYPSGSFSPLLPGAYSWVAAYGGDAGNNTATTACSDPGETSTVTKASPTLTTRATPTASAGGAISDTAILAGGSVPTGTVTFIVFGPNNATCVGTALFTSTKAVTGDGSYPSDPVTPTLAGAYSWVASYSGDVSNTATSTACNDPNETSIVTKSGPTITTSATPSAIVGGAISDTAILAGGNAATGSITFTVFGPNSVACAGTPAFTWTTVVSGDGSYLSGTFSPLLPGAYSWVAAYGGDAGNGAVTTACNDPGETSTVAKAGPSITTRATPSATAGGAISDTAILAGGSLPTGTITFNLFGPGNATCSGTPIFTSAKAVGGNGAYTSDPFSPAAAGAYGWVASYSGDVSNNAASTACNDANETSTVTKASPTITTSATPSANVGGSISDTATIAGGSQPAGTITFSLFGANDTTCAGPVLFTSIKTVGGDSSYPSDPFSAAPPTAGSPLTAATPATTAPRRLATTPTKPRL